MIREEHDIQCMLCSSQIISEMLPEIHTVEKCYFLKPIIHSQNNVILCFIWSSLFPLIFIVGVRKLFSEYWCFVLKSMMYI